MECKLCWRGKENFWGNELIDTLWNVNHACNDRKLSCPGELIDTLWNVNLCTAS